MLQFMVPVSSLLTVLVPVYISEENVCFRKTSIHPWSHQSLLKACSLQSQAGPVGGGAGSSLPRPPPTPAQSSPPGEQAKEKNSAQY